MRRSATAGTLLGLFIFVAGLLGTAYAHAGLVAADPADRTVVEEPPQLLTLTFSEAVETGISRFRVYRIDTELPDLSAEVPERDWQRIAAQAGLLMNEVLDGAENDELRVDAGLGDVQGRSEEVTLSLEEDLEPGAYVAFWRVLSVDTHITEGFLTFIIAGGR